MNPAISTIVFFISQIIFTPCFIHTTNKCVNTDKHKTKYNLLFLMISPFAIYLYVSIISLLISPLIPDEKIVTIITSLSDVIVLLLSLIFAQIYTAICMKLTKWYKAYYITIYAFFSLFQMTFNWTYSTIPGTLLCNIIMPIATLIYFEKYMLPMILNIKNHKEQTKPTKTIIALSLISAGFFVLRSVVIMNITYIGIDIVTNSVMLNVYMTIFTYLILAFLFTGTATILSNIEHSQTILEQAKENEQLTNDMIMSLVRAIDIKDKYTKGHSIRVAQYSQMIAEKLYKEPKQVHKIYQIALLHDIGKLGIPDEIINKPGKLTDEEYEIIKSHTTKGKDILAEIKSLPDIIYGAKYHHERYDGKGYPEGLSGNKIPEIAALIAVADAYDAMTSKRSYKDIMPQNIVREEIKKNIGKQFNPLYAKIMLEIIDDDVNYDLHQ